MIYEMRLRIVPIDDLKPGDVSIMITKASENPKIIMTPRPAVLEIYNGIEWKKVEIVTP